MSLNMSQIENDFQYALERQEFALHYQPKVNLTSGAIAGVEALIRWNHPQRGLLASGKFIPIAEACGAILPIGRWVLREACEQARAWQSAGLPRLRVGINVSTAELRAKDFVEGVRNILAETGMDPRFLELELTEAFLLENPQATGPVLRALKDTGAQLALDDFGTGYSSLGCLKRFPIDTLKIDQSFVRDLAKDRDNAGIVSAVIAIGRSLQKRVVAEGVETREQLAFLRKENCPAGQGFFFSPAVPAADLVELLGG
jgi:EAL domain-containing protein (putative c-di-GMP-specific phosphodiesterase class I)